MTVGFWWFGHDHTDMPQMKMMFPVLPLVVTAVLNLLLAVKSFFATCLLVKLYFVAHVFLSLVVMLTWWTFTQLSSSVLAKQSRSRCHFSHSLFYQVYQTVLLIVHKFVFAAA